MQVFLVRHAEAAPGQPDELRPLTAHGRDQARELGDRLRREGTRVDVVLTSPLLRARETGRLVARELGASLRVSEELAPGATPASLARAVREAAPAGSAVVCVGHQPDCGRIAAALTGEPEPPFPPAASLAVSLE
ncbi:MAG: phosphohistidine phosphatase SixA [Thermoleophilia bacterium]|nr:phosphohistidine phosphatase SixA [Thermoleophilia bacterium]